MRQTIKTSGLIAAVAGTLLSLLPACTYRPSVDDTVWRPHAWNESKIDDVKYKSYNTKIGDCNYIFVEDDSLEPAGLSEGQYLKGVFATKANEGVDVVSFSEGEVKPQEMTIAFKAELATKMQNITGIKQGEAKPVSVLVSTPNFTLRLKEGEALEERKFNGNTYFAMYDEKGNIALIPKYQSELLIDRNNTKDRTLIAPVAYIGTPAFIREKPKCVKQSKPAKNPEYQGTAVKGNMFDLSGSSVPTRK
jgi:hypothetical protein